MKSKELVDVLTDFMTQMGKETVSHVTSNAKLVNNLLQIA